MTNKRNNLLLVDDEPAFRRLMSFLFGQEGYNVVAADNAEDAIKILDLREFNVAVVDYRLPGMTGIDFFDQIKKTHPFITRVLLTAYTSEEVLLEAINRGEVFRYIPKPVHNQLLLSSVDQGVSLNELYRSRMELMTKLENQNVELQRRNDDIRNAYSQLEDLKLLQDQVLGFLVEPLFLVGENNRIIGCNRSACQLSGYTRSELLGRMASELFGEEYLEMTKSSILIKEGIEPISNASMHCRDGTVISVNGDIHLLKAAGQKDAFKMALVVRRTDDVPDDFHPNDTFTPPKDSFIN